MPHIRVVTDSTCDLPDALLRQFDITMVSHSIQFGTETYLDRIGISTSQLLMRLEDGEPNPLQVVAPSIDDFSRVYRSLRETCDGIISVHISSRLSETLTNAGVAREAFGPVGHGGPFPIAVVDSQSMSMGLGWIALALARAAMSGSDLAKLASLATRLRGQTHVAFITEHLYGLMKNGLVANLAPQWHSIAAMKPLLHIDEGQIAVYERTRTRAKARDALYNFVEDFPKIGEIAVIYTGPQNDLEHLLTRVGAIYPRERIVILQPNPSVAAWLGQEALLVAVFEGEE